MKIECLVPECLSKKGMVLPWKLKSNARKNSSNKTINITWFCNLCSWSQLASTVGQELIKTQPVKTYHDCVPGFSALQS